MCIYIYALIISEHIHNLKTWVLLFFLVGNQKRNVKSLSTTRSKRNFLRVSMRWKQSTKLVLSLELHLRFPLLSFRFFFFLNLSLSLYIASCSLISTGRAEEACQEREACSTHLKRSEPCALCSQSLCFRGE